MGYFVHNDQRLFYREQGSGPLLLIVPGNTSSSACHQGELDYFGQHYHTVVLDLPGTGQSDRVASWPANWWEQGAHAAAALLQHLHQQQCIVMGTSGGAAVALLMAIFHAECVAAVVADSIVEHQLPTRLRAEVAARTQPMPDLVAFWQHAHGDDWQQVVAADNDLLLRFAERGDDMFEGRLKRVYCPVLLTGSLRDATLPDIGMQSLNMAEQIGDCRVFLISEGDHPLMWTRPNDFRQVSTYFLRTVLQEKSIG